MKNKEKVNYPVYNLQPCLPGLKVLGVLCLDCSWIGVSFWTHDYKTCPCPNQAMIDGGLSYNRYGAMKMERIQLLDIKVPKKLKGSRSA